VTTEAQQAKQPLHWRRVLKRTNADYLFAEDIGEAGTKVDVVIVDSSTDKLKNEDGLTEMPVLSFDGKKKRLALNRTNCKVMEKICETPDINAWRGPITLLVIRTKIAGEDMDVIRIAPKRPAGKVKP
jgi:hypothetical protein